MTTIDHNLRKAAILLRNLDGDTAAVMLAQLSPSEATALRSAMRELRAVDPDEEADVVAEFRRTRPALASKNEKGVELEFSPSTESQPSTVPAAPAAEIRAASTKRFEFLDSAPVAALVPYLAREHAQTIAVVLAHLVPARAASVLAALPEKLQADTLERLAALGETDPETVTVLERELASWMATRSENRGTLHRRRETVANILAAADPATRRGILNKLERRNVALAQQLAPRGQKPDSTKVPLSKPRRRYESQQAADTNERIRARLAAAERRINHPLPTVSRPAPPPPSIEFDELGRLDIQTLAAVLRDVDANILAIALAGSDAQLIDRICQQMPKQSARAFRREVRRIGPTRLSDVDVAQRTVAAAAARHLAARSGLEVTRT